MTLTASRSPRHPNAPDTLPESIVIRTTYGPITNEVTEELRSVKHFWGQLGRLIEELENATD